MLSGNHFAGGMDYGGYGGADGDAGQHYGDGGGGGGFQTFLGSGGGGGGGGQTAMYAGGSDGRYGVDPSQLHASSHASYGGDGGYGDVYGQQQQQQQYGGGYQQHAQQQPQQQYGGGGYQQPQQAQLFAPAPVPGPQDGDASLIKTRGHVYEHRGKRLEIRDVWRDNLAEEMRQIRRVIERYPYVAMDTEFPGVVARPIGSASSALDFQYQTLRCNVDLLKLIQLGIALADEQGEFAEGCPCWQFHFKFSLADDMYAQDSIDLLVRSGIDFELHDKMGIDVADFGELLMSSGLVLLEDVKWISFHGGYDFGYLLKLLTSAPLPAGEAEFFRLLHTYFPSIFDVKAIMSKLEGAPFKGGLSKLAEELGAERIGPMHQAGSDSLLTASTFFALQKRFFNNNFNEQGHVGVLHGLGDAGRAH